MSAPNPGAGVQPKTLIVIVGPTAVGKTALAVYIAQRFGTEIISADSRQFFRELNIGTAKPSPAELSIVKHYFINSHSIDEDFSVGDFERFGSAILNQIFKQRDIAVLTGGSGLYINAICEGFDSLPKADHRIREELNQQFVTEGIGALQAQLYKADPVYYKKADLTNPQRLIRALEVYISTGKPFSSYHSNQKKERPYNIIKIGLNTRREMLYEQINERVDRMISEGLVEEARSLLPYRDLNALNTVGYSELFDFFDNKTSLEDAVALIKQNTRRFAKRQLTWFRKDKEINWFEPDEYPEIEKFIIDNIQPGGRSMPAQ